MPGTQTSSDGALNRWRERVESQTATARVRQHDRERRPLREPVEHPRTVAEAATELGLSVHTIRAWIAMRRIAHIRLGRAIRIPAAEIRRLIEKHTVPAIEER
jgi:excisionase family DNA binding protein